ISQCDSAAAFAREVKDAAQIIEQDETEQNWDKIGRELQRVAALFRGGAYEFEVEVVAAIRPLTIPIVNAMKSERSRLSFEAIELVSTLAGLGRAYEPLLRNFFSTLLELCTRTSKILVARAQAAVMRTIEETRLAAVVPHLRDATKDKSQSLRTVASTAILRVLNILSRAELNSKAADIEEIIKNTGRDSNPAVRQISRQVFEAYQLLFPERVDAYVTLLRFNLRLTRHPASLLH
ncbi:clasp N-terminal domain-containing protein, partial [Auriculariales sp. MPI-PUGE-AT-0066]